MIRASALILCTISINKLANLKSKIMNKNAAQYALISLAPHAKGIGLSSNLRRILSVEEAKAKKELNNDPALEGYKVFGQSSMVPKVQFHTSDEMWVELIKLLLAFINKELFPDGDDKITLAQIKEIESWNDFDEKYAGGEEDFHKKMINKLSATLDDTNKIAVLGRYMTVPTGVWHRWKRTAKDEWSEPTESRMDFFTPEELEEDITAIAASRIRRQIAKAAKLGEKALIMSAEAPQPSEDIMEE